MHGVLNLSTTGKEEFFKNSSHKTTFRNGQITIPSSGYLTIHYGDFVDKVISRDTQVALASSTYLNLTFGDLFSSISKFIPSNKNKVMAD